MHRLGMFDRLLTYLKSQTGALKTDADVTTVNAVDALPNIASNFTDFVAQVKSTQFLNSIKPS